MTRLTALLTFFFLIGSTLICAAQDNHGDTNFPDGPQYLVTQGSPIFLHSIETPSLSLSEPRSEAPNAPAEEHTGEPNSPAFGGLQNAAQVDQVYWGVAPNGEPVPNPAAAPIFIIGSSSAPPPSGFDAGVSEITTASDLRRKGYGVSLAQAAAYSRSHQQGVVRLYTNEDINNLPTK